MAIAVSGRKVRDRNTIDSRADYVAGTYCPGTTTTGIMGGTTLTTYTGPTTITTDNTVIQNKEIFDSISIRAANVTIDNCKIRGTAGASYIVDCTNAACVNATITNCEIFPDVPSHDYNGIQGHGMTVKWCDIHDTVDGVNLFYANTANNSQILMNYIHDLSYFTPDSNHTDNQTHNDGIQVQGSRGPMLIKGNFVDMRGYSQTSGTVSLIPDRGTGDDSNGRYNQGAFTCIQMTDAPNNVYPVSSPGALIQVHDNWLFGSYRPLAAASADSDVGEWYRNRFDDTQGLRSGLGTHQGYTVLLDATTTCLTGDGTANANVWDSDGTEVLVRRNQ